MTKCLRNGDAPVAAAAAAALGEIGTAKAGRALRDCLIRTPESLRRNLADALLVCAEHLRQQNRKADAPAVLKVLLTPGQPPYIQQAAQRALRA